MSRWSIMLVLAAAVLAAKPEAASTKPLPALKTKADPKAKAHPKAEVDPKAQLRAAETAAWQTAQPTFTKYCSNCHTKAGKKATRKKLRRFTMDSYPFEGRNAATIGVAIREVLGINGKEPTMPSDRPGSVTGDDLAAIKAWTDAWLIADRGGAHSAPEEHPH